MKKKISLLICMLMTVLCFTGCASEKAELKYDEVMVEQITDFLISYCTSTDEATIEQWKNLSEFQMEYQLMQAGLPFTPESFKGALESWEAGEKDCGQYVGHGDYSYEVSGSELKVTTKAEFSERDALTFIFDDQLLMSSMTVDAEYTTGEILQKAGLNTLLGMGTVFAVLIFICLIISLFRFIPALERAFKKQPKSEVTIIPAPVKESVSDVVSEDVTDDTELVAVIAAAIAAYEGTTTDGFVVRSIRRRPANKWKA